MRFTIARRDQFSSDIYVKAIVDDSHYYAHRFAFRDMQIDDVRTLKRRMENSQIDELHCLSSEHWYGPFDLRTGAALDPETVSEFD